MKKLLVAFSVLCAIALPSTSFAQTKTQGFAWDAPVGGGPVEGYRLFVSTSPGVYDYSTPAATFAGATTLTGTLTVPADGVKRYVVGTAYHSVNGQSGPSNEVSFTPPDLRPPGVPQNLRLVAEFSLIDGKMQLTRIYAETGN